MPCYQHENATNYMTEMNSVIQARESAGEGQLLENRGLAMGVDAVWSDGQHL